ncbi:hypothetical protein D3C76_506710 [compost metagenome]
MAALEYSNDALNVKAAFYGADKMVYVEGDDDVIFWEGILKTFEKSGYQVEAVGGLEELDKKIRKIESQQIDAVAARDADFTGLNSNFRLTRNVLLTYGHSIENSLITPAALYRLAKVYGRIPDGILTQAEFDDWLVELEDSFGDLIFLDAANDIGELGVAVLGNNCSRYMTSNQSCSPSRPKIEDSISELSKNLNLVAGSIVIRSQFALLGKRLIDFMRGHFLATAAMKKVNRLISRHGASKAVNNDSFTSSLMMGFEYFFNNTHPHYEHYRGQIQLV